MTHRRARVLVRDDVCRLLDHVAHRRYPDRDKVIILLSFYAGLRACEIAGLAWPMVLASDCTIDDVATLSGGIAKGGRIRSVPIAPKLRTALKRLHRRQQAPSAGPVIRSERLGHMTPRSVVNWFALLYRELGLDGCSSHSGRRTFITRTARLVTKTGGSLRDVQELAGHRSLTTTERYIEGDRAAQRKLVALL
ncbi:MAG TPA: site-specific integrase [Sphingomicrobium sp.]|jgi:integrase/recombinase XerD